MGVKIYTSPDCIYCNMTKKYLETKNIRFCEINIAGNSAAVAEMVGKSGQRGVPVIDFNGTVIVGFDKDKIDSLL